LEYVAGDRVPTRHRSIRRIAAASPQFFAMEYGTEPLDLQWLASIEADAEGRYEAVKRRREAEKDQRERALRDELKSQNRSQPELERRFEKQEAERRRWEEEAREECERESSNGRSDLQVISDPDSTSSEGEKHGNCHSEATDDDRQGSLRHCCWRKANYL
jgi:hypothetical protein